MKSVERFSSFQDRADRRQILDHVRRPDPRQRALLVVALPGAKILRIASAAAACSLRIAASSSRDFRLRRTGPARPRNSRTCSGAPSRPSHCQTGDSEARRIWPGRAGALPSTRKGSSGAEEQTRKVAAPRLRLVAAGSYDLAQLLEYERGNGGVFAALNRALELPHQHRLRLRRKLRQVIPQPLDWCLAHAPDLHVLPREKRAR